MQRSLLVGIVGLLFVVGYVAAEEGGLSVSKLSKLGLADLDIAEGAAPDETNAEEQRQSAEQGDATANNSNELLQVTRTIDPLRNLSLPTIENLVTPRAGENASTIARRLSPLPADAISDVGDQLDIDGDMNKLDAQVALRRRQLRQAQRLSELAAREAGVAAARRLALQSEIARLKRELAAAAQEVQQKTLAARVAAAQLARQRTALEEATAEKSSAEKRDAEQNNGVQSGVPVVNPLRLGAFPE